MSPLRRATWATVLILVALTACRKKEEAPAGAEEKPGAAAPARVETRAVAGDLPAGAALVVSAYDLESYWNRLKSTQLYTQLRSIPEIQRALDPKQNPRLAQSLQRFQAATGVPLNEQTLFRTLGKKVQVGLYPTPGDTAAHRLVLVADMGDKDALAGILSSLRAEAEGKGARFRGETYKGVDLTVITDSTGAVRGLYGFHKEKLVAARDQGGFQSAVDALDGNAPAMAKDTLYQRALTHIGDASVTVFVNRGGYRGLVTAMDRARAAAGDTAVVGEAERMIEVMDKYNFQSATIVGSRWGDEGLQVRSYAMLDPSAAGAAPLREMLKTPPSQVEVLGYFPDSTLGFYAVNFLDAPKIYDFAVGYFKDLERVRETSGAGGDPAARVDRQIAQFEQQTGMSIRNDVLGWMGKEAGVGLNGVVKGGFFPVPEVSLAIQAADLPRAQAFFGRVEQILTETLKRSPQGFPVQFQEESYKGVKVRYAPTPMGEGLAPAYALHEDYALVALSRGTLERMIDVKAGAAPAVGSNAQFKALSGFFPGQANLMGYANTLQLFTEIGSLLTTFKQMGGPQASPETQDALTRLIEALKNIQAVGSYGLNDAGGVEQRVLVKIQ